MLTPLQRIFVLITFGIVIVLARLHTYHEPLDQDIATYAVIGKELSVGKNLYSDLWDHKPPAIHVTYMVSQAITGYGPQAIYFLGVTASVLILVAVYKAGSAGGAGSGGGLWAATFWVVLSGDLGLEANQPNTEAFLNASLAWAFALLVRANQGVLGFGRAIAIGALFALASLYKQVAIVHLGLLCWAHIACPPIGHPGRRRAVKEGATIAGVSMLTWAVVCIYFVAVGRFTPFYEAVFTFNRYYTGSMLANLLASIHPFFLLPVEMHVALPLIALVCTGLALQKNKGPARPWMLLLAFAIATQMAIALPGRFFPHYYQLWLPPLVISAGWAAASLLKITKSSLIWLPHLAPAGVLGLLLFFEIPLYRLDANEWSQRKYGELYVACDKLGREIGMLLRPEETFYEWGNEAGLYFASRRRPASGIFLTYSTLSGPLAAQLSARVVSDLTSHPPEVFIFWKGDPALIHPSHPVIQWFSTRYRPFPDTPERGIFQLFIRRTGLLEGRLDKIRVVSSIH